MCRSWFVKCYMSFEKARLQRDAGGKVVRVITDTGQSFSNFLFKCKRCVITFWLIAKGFLLILPRCGKSISRHAGSNTTSNLVKHERLCCPRENVQLQQDMMNSFASGSTYRHEKLWTFIVRWVMGCRWPMLIIGDSDFRGLIKMPNLQAIVLSRNTVTQDIETMYSLTKVNLATILQVCTSTIPLLY